METYERNNKEREREREREEQKRVLWKLMIIL